MNKKLIEKLKKNERAYTFLSDEEKECLEDVGYAFIHVLLPEGEWYMIDTEFHNGMIYKIIQEYALPLEDCPVMTGTLESYDVKHLYLAKKISEIFDWLNDHTVK